MVALAQLSHRLPADMGCLVAIFAISSLIDDQNSLGRGSSCWVLAQHVEPTCLYVPLIPIRFREKPLQRLRSWERSSNYGFGVHHSCQRLVPFARQQQTLHISPKSIALIARAKESINVFHLFLSGCWGSCSFDSFGHLLLCLLCPHSPFLFPRQQTTVTRAPFASKHAPLAWSSLSPMLFFF